MNSAKLVDVSLSANPNAKVVDSTDGINGKINVTSDGRGYVVLKIEDQSNIFKIAKKTRTYSQQFNSAGVPVWPGLTPAQMLAHKGKMIPGRFVTLQVEPYEIGDRTVSSYTTFVASHENVLTVFANEGHPVVQEVIEVASGSPVEG